MMTDVVHLARCACLQNGADHHHQTVHSAPHFPLAVAVVCMRMMNHERAVRLMASIWLSVLLSFVVGGRQCVPEEICAVPALVHETAMAAWAMSI